MAAKEYTGEKIGHLEVLEKTGQRESRYVVWKCRCDCGREILVSAKKLGRKSVTSCGCDRKKVSNPKIGEECSKRLRCDLSKQKFGRLTPLYPTEKRDRKSSVYWHCRCDCGNEVDVTHDRLVYGKYQSCGCRKREVQKEVHSQLHMVNGTCIEWLSKRKHRQDNKSGFRGVTLTKNGRYRVSIGFKKQRYYIGSYHSMQEAVDARLEAEELIHDGFLRAYQTWSERAGQDPAWGQEHPLVYDVVKKDGSFRVITE